MIKFKEKQDYLIIVVAIIIIVVFVFLTLFITFREISRPQTAPVSQAFPRTKPNINYVPGSLGKAFVKLTSRTPLSSQDLVAKENLLKIIDSFGLIYQTSNYSIKYVRSMDDVEIEILTENVELAKTEAENYLLSQGFSQNGLCNLPVRFYVGTAVRKKLPEWFLFNPLAKGC